MKKIYNKFLIISTIFLFLGGVYLYFSKDLNTDTIIPVAIGSSALESSNDENLNSISSTVEPSSKIESDISFLKTIASIKKISMDTTLFTDLNFISLKNNEVKIEKVEAGRLNPFAPIQ